MLGRISGLFGVKGWVKVFSFTQPREAILDYDRWYLKRKGEWQATSIREGKRHSKTVIVQIEGVDDREDAALFVGCDIAVSKEDMPDAEDGRYALDFTLSRPSSGQPGAVHVHGRARWPAGAESGIEHGSVHLTTAFAR